jgi:hypothetical protein
MLGFSSLLFVLLVNATERQSGSLGVKRDRDCKVELELNDYLRIRTEMGENL